jgi:D-sedoheptulose 7-phosphate isomerase
MDRTKLVEEYLESYLNRLNNIFDKINSKQLTKIINIMVETFSNNNTVYVIGNGGSASTASHMQSDFGFFLRNYTKFRPRVVSLADNIALISAIGNDTSYEDIFMEQLNGKFNSGDTLIAISASGNSTNVVKAIEYANNIGGNTIAFTGFDGGRLHSIADYSLHTPNELGDYGPIEDMHMIFNHVIVNYLAQDKDFLAIK